MYLKAKITLGEELVAAFLFAVDQQCQMWIDKCLLVDDQSEVNNINLFFDDIINKISLSEYNINLP
eukprot:15037078-Ditylum_brightwellii.AAC.1